MEINITNRINQYEAAVCQLLYSKNLYRMHIEKQASYVYFTASAAVIAKRTLEGCSS